MSILSRVEKYGLDPAEGRYLRLSFETEYRGVWQCRWSHTGMSEFPNEPPFESLKQSEQEAVEEIGPIVFFLTFGEWPEDLSISET